MSRAYALRNGWRWVGWYLRRGRVLAALRQAWSAYALGKDSEACQECGRDYLLWHARDALYSEVTGRVGVDGQVAPGLFCLACFDRMAANQGLTIIWQPEVYPGTSRLAEPGQPT